MSVIGPRTVRFHPSLNVGPGHSLLWIFAFIWAIGEAGVEGFAIMLALLFAWIGWRGDRDHGRNNQ